MDRRHRQYLQAIGIDVWVRRDNPPLPEGDAASARASAETDAPQSLPEAAISRSPPAPQPAAAPSPQLATAVPGPSAEGAPTGTVDEEWERLRAQVLSCTKCALHSSRTQGVFGVGNRQADWLVIGEAPGADEDRLGEPFVGRAGQLLDAMLRAIGLSRATNVYIANVLKSRPPGNRDPKPEEVAACLPYLKQQIALLKPRLMLAVGRIAAQNLLGTELALGRLRGKVHHFGELNIPLVVTYHPSYLLRSPGEKRKAWEDLKLARRCFQGTAARSV